MASGSSTAHGKRPKRGRRARRGRTGSLSVVGLGIAGPAHVTSSTLAAMRSADKRFILVADPLTREWLREIAPRAEDLSDAYALGKSRDDSYAEMIERMLAPVRRGQRVCAIFYGHPGVFAYPPHEAVRRARAEGFAARMLPGISAVDCLFADVGVDPGEVGCQEFEATDFVLRKRRFDSSSALILWQIGLVGVEDVRDADLWSREGLRVLVEVLRETYPPTHEVIVYEASTLPIVPPKILRMPLSALAEGAVTAISTLYIPPLPDRETDLGMLQRLGLVP